MSELTQTVDGQDVTLQAIATYLKDKINKLYPGTVSEVYTSSGILATTFKVNALCIYRLRSKGNSLQETTIRLEYLTADNADRQSGDANFRALSLAISDFLKEFKLTQLMHPLQIDLDSLACEYRFPILRIDFDAVETPGLKQF